MRTWCARCPKDGTASSRMKLQRAVAVMYELGIKPGSSGSPTLQSQKQALSLNPELAILARLARELLRFVFGDYRNISVLQRYWL